MLSPSSINNNFKDYRYHTGYESNLDVQKFEKMKNECLLLLLSLSLNAVCSFQYPATAIFQNPAKKSTLRMSEPSENDLSYLKVELTSYLEKRKEVNADQLAQK